MCAARTASELNAIAGDMQAPTSTIPALLDHLESMFLIKRLPAWSKNLSERVIRRPKLLMTDSGFAASLAHLNAESMGITRNPDAAGAILETFVLGELRRQNGWSAQRVDFFHYRDREGREVDLIADLGDGRVVAIEVKASSTPTAADTKHLRWLSERLGSNFIAASSSTQVHARFPLRPTFSPYRLNCCGHEFPSRHVETVDSCAKRRCPE
jgi:uncharacterized protein